MKTALVLALAAVALAACSRGPTTPEDVCAQESSRDPKVVAMRNEVNGNLNMQQTLGPQILQARREAMGACLARLGMAPPGGVQPQSPYSK